MCCKIEMDCNALPTLLHHIIGLASARAHAGGGAGLRRYARNDDASPI
jgi:hypothetical protein